MIPPPLETTMRTSFTILAAACAGAMLMACAGGGFQSAPVQQRAAASPGASADGYYALGRSQYAAHRYAEAMQSYRRALEIEPRHVNARNGLAAVHAGQGDMRAAIALWQALAAEQDAGANADSAYLLANLGYAYFLAGDHAQAVAMLEKACVLDPLNPLDWEHLGMALQASGMGPRAEAMFRQAATLRAHDVRQDLALSAPGTASPALEQALHQDTMERTEVIQAGAALVQVRRVAAHAAPSAAVPPADAAPLPLRVEISNGNGIAGFAARTARTLQGPRIKVVRLSNMPHFAVPVSRIEYQQEQQAAARTLSERLGVPLLVANPDCRRADLRVVLGRDIANKKTVRGDPDGEKHTHVFSVAASAFLGLLPADAAQSTRAGVPIGWLAVDGG
jgi:tetratricopeptide (TPR) repeat protein